MKTTRLIFSLTLSIFLAATARANLKWEQTSIELHPSVTDTQAIAHFKYENAGKDPIHFKSVHASCGCTTTQTQKEIVNPGDKGEVTATFNIGDRTGTQVKTITVVTDNPDVTTMLTLKAIIPQALEVSPTFVFWQDKEAPKPKTIMVSASKDFPVKGIKATSSSPDFEAKVEKAGKGQFKVEVTPRDTSRMLAGTITIQPEDSKKLFYVNIRVMGPPTPMAPAGVAPAALAAPTPANGTGTNMTPPVPANGSGADGVAPTPVNNPGANSAPPTPVNPAANPTSTTPPTPQH